MGGENFTVRREDRKGRGLTFPITVFTFIIHLWFIKLKQSPTLIKLRKSVFTFPFAYGTYLSLYTWLWLGQTYSQPSAISTDPGNEGKILYD
jgi:hypothetical protein